MHIDFPASANQVKGVAEEIHVLVAGSAPRAVELRPIGYNWLTRFKTRHSEMPGIWTMPLQVAITNLVHYYCYLEFVRSVAGA